MQSTTTAVITNDETTDLFAVFATRITGTDGDEMFWAGIQSALCQLCDTTDPSTLPVLNAIHAERRQRQSAATREARRG